MTKPLANTQPSEEPEDLNLRSQAALTGIGTVRLFFWIINKVTSYVWWWILFGCVLLFLKDQLPIEQVPDRVGIAGVLSLIGGCVLGLFAWLGVWAYCDFSESESARSLGKAVWWIWFGSCAVFFLTLIASSLLGLV